MAGLKQELSGKEMLDIFIQMKIIIIFYFLASNTLKISRNGSTSATSASIDLNKMYFYAITSQADGTSNIYLGDLNSSPALSGSADQSAGNSTRKLNSHSHRKRS